MTDRALNSARMILLVLAILLLAVTAYSYFQTVKFNFWSVVSALGCLVIFLVTRRRSG